MKNILYKSQKNYLNSLIKDVDPLLQEMEDFAKEHKVPILDPSAAEFLEQMVAIHRPNRVLEIGTAIGYSSIRITKNLKPKACLDTIEFSKDNIQLATGYINRSDYTDRIRILEGDALDIMPEMKEKYDFIFLDADKEDYEKLFYYSLLLLNKKGVIFIDNLLWHGFVASSKVPADYKRSTAQIRKFNQFFISQRALKTSIIPIGDGIGLGVKID